MPHGFSIQRAPKFIHRANDDESESSSEDERRNFGLPLPGQRHNTQALRSTLSEDPGSQHLTSYSQDISQLFPVNSLIKLPSFVYEDNGSGMGESNHPIPSHQPPEMNISSTSTLTGSIDSLDLDHPKYIGSSSSIIPLEIDGFDRDQSGFSDQSIEPLSNWDRCTSDFSIDQAKIRLKFALLGIVVGLLISIFFIYPLLFAFRTSWFSDRSTYASQNLPSYTSVNGDKCQMPFDVVKNQLSWISTGYFQWFLVFTLVIGQVFVRVAAFSSYFTMFQSFYHKKLMFHLKLVIAFYFVVLSVRMIDLLYLHSISFTIANLFPFLFGIIVIIWYFDGLQRIVAIPNLFKFGALIALLSALGLFLYFTFLSSVYFGIESDIYKILFRILIHPFIAECILLAYRYLSEYLSINFPENVRNTYVFLLGPQFFVILVGRFLSFSLSTPTAILITNILILVQDTFFRATTWYRDFYFFYKNSGTTIFDSKESLSKIMDYENSAYIHYHLYYTDEIASHSSIICASALIYLSKYRQNDGSALTFEQLALQTLIAVLLELATDFFRSYASFKISEPRLKQIFSSSVSPFTLPLSSNPNAPFYQVLACWYSNIDIWVHTFWRYHRLPHFFFWISFIYSSITLTFFQQFIWRHSCIYPDGSTSFH